jgi:serine protease
MASNVVKQAYAASCYQCNQPHQCFTNKIAQAITLLRSGATDTGAGYLHPGDVLLLEVQRSLLPTEIDNADFNAIQLAVAHGVIVIEAAGNGARNLNDVAETNLSTLTTSWPFQERDSGAIMVGAVKKQQDTNNVHPILDSSNRGDRIDCYAWGEGVATIGNDNFDGTSAAAAKIAGAALLLQAHYRTTHHMGDSLTPEQMRQALTTSLTGDIDLGMVPKLSDIVANLPQ